MNDNRLSEIQSKINDFNEYGDEYEIHPKRFKIRVDSPRANQRLNSLKFTKHKIDMPMFNDTMETRPLYDLNYEDNILDIENRQAPFHNIEELYEYIEDRDAMLSDEESKRFEEIIKRILAKMGYNDLIDELQPEDYDEFYTLLEATYSI